MRNIGIDWVRVAMTSLVVFHHTAIVYGGSGGWFWREEANMSNLILVLINTINQSYFMGIFFLLAGYFTPGSFSRKGPWKFLKDRLVRLGVPFLIFFLVLHPMTVAIARTTSGYSFVHAWWDATRDLDFAPGPLWFAEALLIFTLAFALWKAVFDRTGKPVAPVKFPPAPMLAIAALFIGLVSFAVRLELPVGTEVLWLQLGYFPGYIALFVVGCVTAESRLLETVRFKIAMPWILVTAACICVLPVILITRMGAGAFEGGWTLNALFYAVWDPFMALGMILGLLWMAQRWWTRPTLVGDWLARRAFGAYIVHPPLVVGFSVWAAQWAAPSLVKFAVVGAVSCVASFALSGLLRKIPGVGSVL